MAARSFSRPTAVLVLAMILLVPGSSRAEIDKCSGFAPVETSCRTGEFSRGADPLAHDVDADFNFVGTIESVIESAAGKRTFRCTYVPLQERNCISLGRFPNTGQTFEHYCRAIIPGSVIDPAGVEGVEGGYGLWQCSVTH